MFIHKLERGLDVLHGLGADCVERDGALLACFGWGIGEEDFRGEVAGFACGRVGFPGCVLDGA